MKKGMMASIGLLSACLATIAAVVSNPDIEAWQKVLVGTVFGILALSAVVELINAAPTSRREGRTYQPVADWEPGVQGERENREGECPN